MKIYDDLPEYLLYDVDDPEAQTDDFLKSQFEQEVQERLPAPEIERRILWMARRHLENDVQGDTLRQRAKELVEKARRRDSDCDRLKQNMLLLMQQGALQKVKDEEFTVSLSTRAGGIDVLDLELLPLTFVRLKREANKIDLNDHYRKTGEIPDGCTVAEDKTVVNIRSK